MAGETNDNSGSGSSGAPAPAESEVGPHGATPLRFSKQPKVEIVIDNSARRNLWAKGNRAPDPAKKSTDGPSRKAKAGPLLEKIYYDKAYFSTKEDGETSFFELLHAKAQVELLSASRDLSQGVAKLTLAKVNVKGVLARAQVDLIEAFGDLLFPPPSQPAPPPFTPPAPGAARVGDPTCHGSPLCPGSGSPDVLIGGLPAWRASIDVHLCAMPGHGSGSAWSGASNVLINGSPATRAGDYVLEPGGGTNVILRGEQTVLVGPRASAPPVPAVSTLADELPWVKIEAILKEEVGTAGADAALEAEVDADAGKGGAELQLGGGVALAEIALALRMRLRIPGTASYLGLGVTPQLGALGVAAEGGWTAKLDPANRRFQLTNGAKVNLGVGAGIKFSIDVSE